MRLELKKGAVKRFEWGNAIFGAISLMSLFLILKNSDLAIDYMNRGMKLCVSTLIPSLFPFMVASELIVLSGATERLGFLIEKPSKALLGISGKCSSAFLLGAVCGFPIGTRAAVTMYKNGMITHGELCRVICFSNNPSSAFVISAVGETLFGSKSFGIALYFVTLAASMIIGVILKCLYGQAYKEDAILPSKEISHGSKNGISSFSSAIVCAATSMLSVCAFVIFFSVLTGLIGNILNAFGVSQCIKALTVAFFELTGGVAAAAGVGSIELAVIVAAFAVGWSGISVHFQIAAICDGIGVRMGRYVLSKLLQGILNALFMWIFFRFFGGSVTFDAKSVEAFNYIMGVGGERDLNIFISSVLFSVLCLTFFSWVKRVSRLKI